jgi:hypothetical protein
MTARLTAFGAACALVAAIASPIAGQAGRPRTFQTPDAAVTALITAARTQNLDELLMIFGPDGKDLIASSDPATARANREVFTVAAAEQWHLVDEGKGKTLVIGYEEWPFPVPLVKDAGGWRFDTAAAREEVLARRIGRNELAAIQTCLAYVTAQRRYAMDGHDGKRAGLYATTFRSDAGKENGPYWPVARGKRGVRSAIWWQRRRRRAAARRRGRAGASVSRLLLQDPDRRRISGARQCQELHRRR